MILITSPFGVDAVSLLVVEGQDFLNTFSFGIDYLYLLVLMLCSGGDPCLF